MPIHFKIVNASSKVYVECNATKLFSPRNFPSNDSDQIALEFLLGGSFVQFQVVWVEL
jgi:hypothetical protein